MSQLFQVEKAEAPAEFAFWKLPVGWVKLTDDEGNTAVGAVMKDGVIHGDFMTGAMGVCIGYGDCAATCKAALALFA